MDFKIFNDILFGNLRPYIGKNREEEYFALKFNRSFKLDSYDKLINLENELKECVKDNPRILDSQDTIYSLDLDNDLVVFTNKRDEVFIPTNDKEIPPYFNATTEYYYFTITNEKIRALNELEKEVLSASNEADRREILKNNLLKIEFLLKKTVQELNARSNNNKQVVYATTTESERIRENTYYVINVLQIALIKLYLNVRSTLPTQISGIAKNEAELYKEVLGKTHPQALKDVASKKKTITKAKSIAESQEYDIESTLSVLTKLHQLLQNNISDNEIKKAIAAIENRYFIESHMDDQSNHTFEELCSVELTEIITSELKGSYKKQLEEYAYGFERLELLKEISDSIQIPSFNFKDQPYTIKNSIPRLIDEWLKFQFDLYKDNPSANFPSTYIGTGHHNRTPNHKPKLEFYDINTQKEIARKYLFFFSGSNLKGEKIMTESEYNRLLNYVDYLIENNKVAPISTQIGQIGIPAIFIRYTFYLIHRELYTTNRIRNSWIEFLKVTFVQFKVPAISSIKTNFSQGPKTYEQDMKKMKG